MCSVSELAIGKRLSTAVGTCWHFGSYFRHLCDGAWQCSIGEDENKTFCSSFLNCTGLFKCATDKRRVCLHPVDVCNGVEDCFSGEDEHFCQQPQQCPSSCNCLMYAAMCQNGYAHLTMTLLKLFDHTVFFKLYKMFVPAQPVPLSKNIIIFVWQHSNLSKICSRFTASPESLQLIDFTANRIQRLAEKCIRSSNVKMLLFSRNEIDFLHVNAFISIRRLLRLDISSNCLHDLIIPANFEALQLLNLSDNRFKTFHKSNVQNINVKHLSTNDKKVYCLLSGQVRITGGDWPGQCDRLLSSLSAQVISFIVSISVLCLSCVSLSVSVHKHYYITESQIIGGVKVPQKDKQSKAFCLNTIILFVNDMFIGLFVIALCSADQKYATYFVWYSVQWSSSILCFGLGFLSVFTAFDSLFLSNLLSLSRFLVVKYPFILLIKKSKTILVCATIAKIIWFVVGILVLTSRTGFQAFNQMPFKTCSFIGQTAVSITVSTLTMVVAHLQVAIWFSMTVFYVLIYMEVWKRSQISSQAENISASLLTQAIFFSTYSGICWLPSAIIYISSVLMEGFTTDVLLWNTILVVPVMSIMNPFVYCIYPAIKSK